MKIIVSIFFILCSVATENSNTLSHLKRLLQHNFFHKTNVEIQTLTNKMFTRMKLNKNFTNSNNIKVLLVMYNSLKDIADYNYRTYEEVRNVSKVDWGVDNKTINALFNMSDLMDELFDTNHSLYDNNGTNEDSSAEKPNYVYLFTKRDNKFTTPACVDVQLNETTTNYAGSNLSLRKIFDKNFDDLRIWNQSVNSKEFIELSLNAKQTRRIFKSSSTKIINYPFVASIHILEEFVCAGSVIAKDLVLTSASCMMLTADEKNRTNSSIATVRIGSDYVNRVGALIRVERIYLHPMYKSDYLWNNLAIVRIKEAIKHSSIVKRIEIERKTRFGKSDVMILGWGDKDSHTRYEGPLSMATLPQYSWSRCKQIYDENYVTESTFCAGYVNKGGGACSRDIGGPAIVGSKLVGVVSFGPPKCGTVNVPTVFTSIGDYQHWIDGIANNLSHFDLLHDKKYTVKSKSPTQVNVLREGVAQKKSKSKAQKNWVVCR